MGGFKHHEERMMTRWGFMDLNFPSPQHTITGRSMSVISDLIRAAIDNDQTICLKGIHFAHRDPISRPSQLLRIEPADPKIHEHADKITSLSQVSEMGPR